MTISELIERLEALKAEHGDIQCVVQGCCWSTMADPAYEDDSRTYENRDGKRIHVGRCVVLDNGL